MTGQNIIDEARFLTRTSSTQYSDTEILNGINYIFYPEVIADILQAQGYRNLTMNHAYTDLISSTGLSAGDNGYKGEYAFPSDLLKITRIEISYDGTTFTPARIYETAELNSVHQDDKLEGYSQTNPVVRISRNSFFIYPTTDETVSAGIYIEYEARQSDITTSTSPQFEQSFHYVLVLQSALRYAMKQPDVFNQLWQVKLVELQSKMRLFYRDRFRKRLNIPTVNESYE
jgi:hypothetical protein